MDVLEAFIEDGTIFLDTRNNLKNYRNILSKIEACIDEYANDVSSGVSFRFDFHNLVNLIMKEMKNLSMTELRALSELLQFLSYQRTEISEGLYNLHNIVMEYEVMRYGSLFTESMLERILCNKFYDIFEDYEFIENQFSTKSGKIDIFARQFVSNTPVIIELKKGDDNPYKQLYKYAKDFNDPILIAIGGKRDQTIKDVIHYPYKILYDKYFSHNEIIKYIVGNGVTV